MRRRFRLLPALALTVVACDIFDPAPPELEGVWLVSASNLTDGRVTCDVRGLELVLVLDSEDPDRFTGLARAASFGCSRADTALTVSFSTEPVVNGRIFGDSVAFDIGTPLWSHRGLVDGRSMSGSVTLVLSGLASRPVLRGVFGGARTDTTAATTGP